jgi:hypothetical protein
VAVRRQDDAAEVRAVHHISLAECEGRPPFDAGDMFGDMDVRRSRRTTAEFETKFFTSPLPVICTYKAALRVWPMRRRTTTARFATGWKIKADRA